MIDRNLSRMTCAIPEVVTDVVRIQDDDEDDLSCMATTRDCFSVSKNTSYWKDNINYYMQFNLQLAKELRHECLPSCEAIGAVSSGSIIARIREYMVYITHVPILPIIHRPGWLLRYIVGPHDLSLWESFLGDFIAGITVALTLIPQGLSYASLANMPPVMGLYSAIVPQAVYSVFGSSMKLAIGPVALVSLLMGTIVAQYVNGYSNYAKDPVVYENLVDTGAQACLCIGIILVSMSILNMGNFINLLSHPVMSGFTTAAAALIGLSQLGNAFGFPKQAPRQGQVGYPYNYQVMAWFHENWNAVESASSIPINFQDPYNKVITPTSTWYPGGPLIMPYYMDLPYKNPYAIKICFGLYVPMIIIAWIKSQFKATPKRKKQFWFRAFMLLTPLVPFICLLIGGGVTYHILKREDYNFQDVYTMFNDMSALTLKIVGQVPVGVNIGRIPNFIHPWGQFFSDIIPITLIAFMESYSVARRISSQVNELHLLNASQEMWAIGVANMLGSVSSCYPIAGSFSRSSLNYTAGGRTPMSSLVSMFTIILAVGALAQAFYYIPQAVLSAVIFTAIWNLICISDFWEAWKHSKKDFFTMLVTAAITFVFDTSTGLAAGIGTSVLVFLIDSVVAPFYTPKLAEVATNSGRNINIVKLNCELNFLTAARVKDFFSNLTVLEPIKLDESMSMEIGRGHYYHALISHAFDSFLIPQKTRPVTTLPSALVIDIGICRVLDLTGMQCLAEIMHEARVKKVKCVVFNETPEVCQLLTAFGIKNDASSRHVDLDEYISKSSISGFEN